MAFIAFLNRQSGHSTLFFSSLRSIEGLRNKNNELCKFIIENRSFTYNNKDENTDNEIKMTTNIKHTNNNYSQQWPSP